MEHSKHRKFDMEKTVENETWDTNGDSYGRCDVVYFLIYMNDKILLSEKKVDDNIYKDLDVVKALSVTNVQRRMRRTKAIDEPERKKDDKKKIMDKSGKGKKKVEDDDEDFVVEEQKDGGIEKEEPEKKFKLLKAKTTVQPVYDATNSLSLERKSKIREMGCGNMLEFPFDKIHGNLPYIRNPNGKNPLDSDVPREYADEFLKTLDMHRREFRLVEVIEDNDEAVTSGASHRIDDGGDGGKKAGDKGDGEDDDIEMNMGDALDMDVGNESNGGDNNVEGDKENEQVKTSEQAEAEMKAAKEKSEKEAAKTESAEKKKKVEKERKTKEAKQALDLIKEKEEKAKKEKEEKENAKKESVEVVFDAGKGTIAKRKEMQSLAPGLMIQKQIIETFVTVLNYEDRIKIGGNDMRRHYIPINALVSLFQF
ncbi:hypothetical protein Tco_0710648 [Tanacetum coccineum]